MQKKDSLSLKNENNGFGPLSEKRCEGVFYGVGIAVLVSFFGLVEATSYYFHDYEFRLSFKNSEPMHVLTIYFAMISSLILGEIIRRITVSFEEIRHADQRYEGSKWKAFKNCMTFGDKTKTVYYTFAITSGLFYLYHWTKQDIECFPLHVYTALAICSAIFMFLFGAKKLSGAELSHLSETQNKNIADGLAWSYYYGYLHLVLPNLTSTLEKAVAPDYVIGDEDMKDLIEAKKVFIIISKKCICYSGLIDADKKRITSVGRLPAFYLSRAGVEQRPYQHSLYKVTSNSHPDKPKYVIMEYATPLLSMNDMSEGKLAEFSREDRDIQVTAFYNKLKFILDQDTEIAGRYELVLLSDIYDNLADVIYDAVTNAAVKVE